METHQRHYAFCLLLEIILLSDLNYIAVTMTKLEKFQRIIYTVYIQIYYNSCSNGLIYEIKCF